MTEPHELAPGAPEKNTPGSALPIVEAVHLSKSFTDAHGHRLVAVEDFSFSIHPGEWVALLGQSGSGKSTILRCLMGLVSPSGGAVMARGNPFQGVLPNASMVFQTPALFPWLTVEKNIEVGLCAKRMPRDAKDAAIASVIELVGLTHYHDALPRELSGGMRQRVALARALVRRPELLCMDEAFSGLDVLTAENLRQEMLGIWLRRPPPIQSVLMVTHNIEEAVETATRVDILFANPGRLGLQLPNPLPYPRDSQSRAFRELVAIIHEAITRHCLPDTPAPTTRSAPHPDAPPAPTQQQARDLGSLTAATPHTHYQPASAPGAPATDDNAAKPGQLHAIPCVAPGQLLGLLSLLEDAPQDVSVYDLSADLGREFGEIIALVQAAEILGLAETPGKHVRLSKLGERFQAAHRSERRAIFSKQLESLPLFRHVLSQLSDGAVLPETQLLQQIATALPYEDPRRILQTLVAWGRYAGVLNLERDSGSLRQQRTQHPPHSATSQIQTPKHKTQ